MDTDVTPPDEQANAGLWLLSLTAAVVNVGFWHAASVWNGAENYSFLAWLLFGLPLLLVQVFVATPWLLSRIGRGIGAGNPRRDRCVAIAIPVVTIALMIVIFLLDD